MTLIRMWYHANMAYIIRKLTGRDEWLTGKDDIVRRMIARHVKKGLILGDRCGYELSEEGIELVKSL